MVGSVTLSSTSPRRRESGRPGLALDVLSWLSNVWTRFGRFCAGAEVVEVAARVGVHRSTMHRWLVRYLTGPLGGGEPSHPPVSSPRQVADAVEFAVAEMR